LFECIERKKKKEESLSISLQGTRIFLGIK
jgi:hypothetical protein